MPFDKGFERFAATRYLSTGHQAYVHDAKVDPTGHFVATCSSDRYLRVFLMSHNDGGEECCHDDGNPPQGMQLKELCSKRDHSATIHKLAWAHPSFGTYLATASADRTIIIYQLVPIPDRSTSTGGGGAGTKYELTSSSTILLYERDTISDIAFAPRQHGFVVAAACRDGSLRLFDAPTRNEVGKYVPPPPPSTVREYAAAYVSPPTFAPALLAISWNPALAERKRMTLACGYIDGSVVIRSFDVPQAAWSEAVLLLSPSSSSVDKTATAGGPAADYLPANVSHPTPVTCVAWAPSCGRRYHLIATGCSQMLQIIKLTPLPVTTDADKGRAAPLSMGTSTGTGSGSVGGKPSQGNPTAYSTRSGAGADKAAGSGAKSTDDCGVEQRYQFLVQIWRDPTVQCSSLSWNESGTLLGVQREGDASPGSMLLYNQANSGPSQFLWEAAGCF